MLALSMLIWPSLVAQIDWAAEHCSCQAQIARQPSVGQIDITGYPGRVQPKLSCLNMGVAEIEVSIDAGAADAHAIAMRRASRCVCPRAASRIWRSDRQPCPPASAARSIPQEVTNTGRAPQFATSSIRTLRCRYRC
jgi:hypothetical protein